MAGQLAAEILAPRLAASAAAPGTSPNPARPQGADQAFPPQVPIVSPSAKTETNEDAASPAEDYLRLVLNGVSGNTLGEAQASVNAFIDMITGTAEFDAAFAKHLAHQQMLTDAARERRGTAGALVEMAPNFIPGVGDVSGLVADFKDYLENGDQWTAADFAMVAAGLIPGAPNRRTAKAGKKLAENLLQPDAVGDAAAQHTRKLAGKIRTASDLIPAPNTKLYSQGEALNLKDEPLGMIFVRERWPNNSTKKNKDAKENQERAPNQLYDKDTHDLYAPTLRFNNPAGDNFIRFDGYEVSDQGDVLLIDRKSNLTDFWRIHESYESTLRRVKEAIEQNNAAANGGALFKVVYDFSDEAKATAFREFVKKSGYSDVVTVRVRKTYE